MGWGCGADNRTMRLTPTQRENSRRLRQAMTDAERRVWSVLRQIQLDGLRFRSQFAIGRYIVDFICLEARIVVEVDGGQHNVQSEREAVRDAWLREQGFQVIHVWNNEVFENIEGVAEVIALAAANTHPVLHPSRGTGRSNQPP